MSDDLVKAARSSYAPPHYVDGESVRPLLHVLADLIEAQAAEITRLRAALATARREGMKDAAQIAETRHELWHMPHPDDALPFEVCDDISACNDIAAAIRAAAKEGKP